MAALSNSTSLDNLLFNFSPPTKVVGGPTGPGKRFSAFHKSANVLPSPPACSAMHCLQPLDLESSTMLGERVHNWFDLWQQQLIRWELFHPKRTTSFWLWKNAVQTLSRGYWPRKFELSCDKDGRAATWWCCWAHLRVSFATAMKNTCSNCDKYRVFFYCSTLKMTKCQPLKEISELFLPKND